MVRWDTFKGTLLGIAVAVATPVSASVDPLNPTTAVDSLAASPLRQVTIATGDMRLASRFYGDALGMVADKSGRANIVYQRTGIADAVSVKLVAVPADRPALRPTHNALAPGGLAMGMPVSGQAKREAIVTAAGFTSAAGVTSMTLPRGDGSTYTVEEIHYRGPDGVLALGIDRGAMTPVGPIDAGSGIGGPAYASLVVEKLPATEAFLKDVLRYEKRRDAVFTSAGPKGGLGLDAGQRFAFQQWFAPGARTGYLVIMKMLDRPVSVQSSDGLTRRGMTMWSFDTADLNAMAARAVKIGMRVLAKPRKGAPSLIVAMPDGFLVELTKRGAQR
jgi:catechol 2,3-dioxygenase-like lactoylglutathione lyase family enzyme